MIEVIVGGGGFLGTNLRKYLESKGKQVVLLPVEMLLDISGMHAMLSKLGKYHLYYLAAYGNLHGQEDIPQTYTAIVSKLLNLLQATEGTECETILTAGSTSEYGDKTEPMKEDQVLEPRTFYGAAKAAATHLAQAWAKQRNSPIIVFRPASMVGVGEQPIHLIPTLIRSCLFKETMPFEGGYYHDYINVLDVCRALEILSDNGKAHSGEIFNIGSGIQTSNLALKEMVESITKEKANINWDKKINPQNISAVWIADSTRIRNLGWEPKISLYDTLKEMVRAV